MKTLLLAIGDNGDLISDRNMRRKVLTVLRLAISVWMLYHKREYAASEVRNPPLLIIEGGQGQAKASGPLGWGEYEGGSS